MSRKRFALQVATSAMLTSLLLTFRDWLWSE